MEGGGGGLFFERKNILGKRIRALRKNCFFSKLEVSALRRGVALDIGGCVFIIALRRNAESFVDYCRRGWKGNSKGTPKASKGHSV